ncbi:hypothetical protein [Arthrobacter sp. Y-9]|uniref:hypothetical protein n=1 Tax=Arthrobacter sp. Y-9 TaxID=3039385 RepID=UPI00241F9635|nr:hypothetical protein [Arthrobacter sp. Y-9]WFR82677.1 hypothetical protein P9849_08785 [Arthrobacter sp. Y-9]
MTMSGGFYGADVQELRKLATKVQTSGKALESQARMLSSAVGSVSWPGPDGKRFRQLWDSEHSQAMNRAAGFLATAAKSLQLNADEQERSSAASGGTGGGAPGGTAGGTQGTPSVSDLSGKSPAEIQTWWKGLSEAQQQDFIRQHPVEAGNTNGIPFDARVKANEINAQNRLDWLKNHDPEPKINPWLTIGGKPYIDQVAKDHEAWALRQSGIPYLQSVVDGKVHLAAYDPAHSSIVEMIGDYNSDTKHVITYVPGTTTNESSFYNGGVQDMAKYLVQTDSSKSTVAFVYKGTEFPDGGFVEAFLQEAKSDEFVAKTAPTLAAFQNAVDLEKPSGAETVGMGHSWGLRNVTGSELNGAHYDKVIALSGAAMPPGWSPDANTHYSSYTYPDVLQIAEHAGVVGDNYPMKDPAFDRHVYSSPGGTTGLDIINDHSLIATTGADNQSALRDIQKKIYG